MSGPADVDLGGGILLVCSFGQEWFWVCDPCDAFSHLMTRAEAETDAAEHAESHGTTS